MKKKLLILTALVLVCAVLLQGCLPLSALHSAWVQLESVQNSGSVSTPESESLPESSDVATEPSPSTEPLYPLLPQEPVERGYWPLLSPVPFSEIPYLRPDVNAFQSSVEAILAQLDSGVSCDEVIEAYEQLYQLYIDFYTMDTLANIHYTLNLNDSYYELEYNWCEEQAPVIEQAFERCHIAMAESALRDELEACYFGDGYFTYYDENQFYSNDLVVELMQEEAALQTQYMALQNDMTIQWYGEERPVSEVLSDPDISYTNYYVALELYYNKYNPQTAEIFIELIRVRRALATVLGFDTYAEFAYLYYYERDYTPAQAADYLADIAQELVPVYDALSGSASSGEADGDEIIALLGDTAARFGGAISEAYDFMQEYALYDISESTSKMPGSYTTYLEAYEMPFMFITPTGTMDDFLTATHEFGHFVDAYVNCNTTSSIDCAEIFSQGLKLLSLDVADLSSSQRRSLREAKLYDALQVFISQACYSEFERRAYELPEKALTVEGLNDLFLECCEQFASTYPGMDRFIAPGWIDVQHFFIAPYYMISYCLSNDVALQIYQRQLESGDGLTLYMELLSHASYNTLLALLEESNAQSPFVPGRMEELAAFFRTALAE